MPECLGDFIGEENPVRVIEAFVEELDLAAAGFEGMSPAATGRPAYHPAVLLKIYIYGYLNRVQSSRRLERECQRNRELMWLTGRLAPDFKTIADFRRDNGRGIRPVCSQFVSVCRKLKLLAEGVQLNAAGEVELKIKAPWRDGTTHLVMSPLDFMQRLAALVPRPRLHLIRFHGVLAPNAKLRSLVLVSMAASIAWSITAPVAYA